MGRQKKNELDSVLEQLKLSYPPDANDDIEDSLLETEDSDEDKELSSILEKIFAEYDEKTEVDHSTEKTDEPPLVEEQQSDTTHDDPKSEELIVENESILPKSKEQSIKTEEEKVDDVLMQMLGNSYMHRSNEQEDSRDDPSVVTSSNSEAADDASNSLLDDAKSCEDTDFKEEILDTEHELHATLSEYTEPYIIVANDENSFLEEQETIIKPIQDDLDDHDIAEDSKKDVLPEDDFTTDKTAELTKIIDERDYVHDPMQCTISDMHFFKPQKEYDLSSFEAVTSDKEEQDSKKIVSSDTRSAITDKDILLLKKFGYDSEISANGENNHANRVVFDEGKSYAPDKHKIKHGYVGKEFSDISQIPDIKKKYKSDSLFLFMTALIMSIVSVVSIVSDIASVFLLIDFKYSLYIDLILAFAVILLVSPKIYSGFIALLKNDGNNYSLVSIMLIEYFVMLILLNVVYWFLPSAHGSIAIGGYVFTFTALSLWSEWLDCKREMNTFAFISNDDIHYVAERRSYSNDTYSASSFRTKSSLQSEENKYIIRRTRFVSGYHRNTIESTKEKVNILILAGVLPIIATVIGLINSYFDQDPISGINIAAMILFMSVPFSSAIVFSAIEYADHFRLKKRKTFFVGSNASEDISNAETLIFEDTDAVKIVSCSEINPENSSSRSKKWLTIARNVFFALGGPISKILPQDQNSESNINHDVSINSISDNGIDIYFDSSMNILLGDRQYMLSHNIKVKTDINLTGATKGADRSVIYMAFDRVPGIAFILSTKIKNSFAETIELLKQNRINVEVKSFEPEINDYFFELNGIDQPITVIKPSAFEKSGEFDISNSRIVSSSPIELCHAIVSSKITFEEKNKFRKRLVLQAMIGALVSVLIAIASCLPEEQTIVRHIQHFAPILVYCTSFLIFIPNIIHLSSIFKRK